MRFAVIGLLTAIVTGAATYAAAPHLDPHFPPPGTPYAEAKAALLRQGLTVARIRPTQPDHRHPEWDCYFRRGDQCRALFIEKRSDGWGWYVIVLVSRDSGRIVEAREAFNADGLAAIPPPVAADLPHFTGSYFAARDRLRRLGFRPIKAAGEPAITCANSACKKAIKLPEGQCFMDVPICNNYWRSPNGRVVDVMTMGEIRAGNIYHIKWSTWREQRRMTGGDDLPAKH